MNTSKTIAITAAFLGIVGFSGLMRAVYARSPQTQVAVMRQHHNNKIVAEASDGDGEAKDDMEEQQEQASLQPLAKITALQAQQSAEKTIGGKASKVKLENEDGSLVYSVIIGQKEVTVDAGNGNVLYTENDHQNDDKNATSRPKSSIQVPEVQDGETNDDVK
jgi:uncharacterized membrane protein YkoI